MPPARIGLWVLSIGGLALAVRAVLMGPIPLWVALSALAGYVAYCVVGALVPRLEMFADVVWRGDATSGGVALTFDDGPSPLTTPRVLELLARADARATFFVLGEKAARHPAVLKALIDGGHTVGVHGYAHDRLYAFKSPRAVEEDIRRACDAVTRETGRRVRWFRPPRGTGESADCRGREAARSRHRRLVGSWLRRPSKSGSGPRCGSDRARPRARRDRASSRRVGARRLHAGLSRGVAAHSRTDP